jgi:endonuclease/exonuclease/phosphatase family metal-dependent hydrolase
VRVATFNLQHGASADGGPVDAALVGEACAALRADVLALQEVDRGLPRSGGADLAAVAAAATGMELVFGRTLRRDGGEYGNALLVRGVVHRVEHLALPRRFARLPGPWRREPRGAIFATVVVGGLRLRVAATHLAVRAVENGPQLDAVLRALPSDGMPRILLGDLNRRAAITRAPVERSGLELVGGPATFPARRPVARIDHIAVDGFVVNGVEVPRAAISDHRALVAELQPAAKASTI